MTTKNRFSIITALFLSSTLSCHSLFAYDVCAVNGLDQCSIHSQPIENCSNSIYGVIPAAKSNEILLCHSNYLTASNTLSKTPDWVAYHLYASEVPGPDYHRDEYFCPDPCLKSGERAELSDYKGLFPIFNRGHMSPAGDNYWDQNSYKESYFLSNMVPQNPDNNGGIWYKLEQDVDAWAKKYNDLYIISGPIYDYAGISHQEVGENKVWAPAALFKIIYSPGTGKVLGFIIPNQSLDSGTLANYLTSIDKINAATGLDLMSSLPNKIKSTAATELWPIDMQATNKN